jgi:integrase
MNSQLQNIIKNFSLEELRVIKTLVDEIEKQRLSRVGESINIENFTEEYLQYIDNNFSQSYLKSARLSFTHLNRFYDKREPLNEFSVKDAEGFKNYLRSTAPLGYKVYLRNMKAAFNKAVDWEMTTKNPFLKIKFSQHQQVTPRFLTKAELNLVLDNTDSPVITELFIFGFYTGCRLSEIINTRWGNIDLIEQRIIIGDKNFTTKNKKSRLIPICNELAQLLKSRSWGRFNDEFVFSKGNGFPFNRDYVSRYFKKSVRRAGLDEEIHFHSLRHSFASNLAIRGVPIITIKELLGHSSIITTQIYSHSNVESLRNAVAKFDEWG